MSRPCLRQRCGTFLSQRTVWLSLNLPSPQLIRVALENLSRYMDDANPAGIDPQGQYGSFSALFFLDHANVPAFATGRLIAFQYAMLHHPYDVHILENSFLPRLPVAERAAAEEICSRLRTNDAAKRPAHRRGGEGEQPTFRVGHVFKRKGDDEGPMAVIGWRWDEPGACFRFVWVGRSLTPSLVGRGEAEACPLPSRAFLLPPSTHTLISPFRLPDGRHRRSRKGFGQVRRERERGRFGGRLSGSLCGGCSGEDVLQEGGQQVGPECGVGGAVPRRLRRRDGNVACVLRLLVLVLLLPK